MRVILLYIFMSVCGFSAYAHNTDEAFFTIVQKENTIEIEAEFPWTMRNALLAFNSSLENSTNKIDFEKTFVEYIKANLILKDKNGKSFKYLEFQELEKNGHSHQNNYLILFKGTDLYEVTNTIMFNLSDHQINFNTITINSKTKTFKTTKSSSRFYIEKETNSYYWYLTLLVIPLIYIIRRFFVKKRRQ